MTGKYPLKHALIHDCVNRTGMWASALCAVHCAAAPLLMTALPLLGLNALAGTAAEWTLSFFAIALAVGALCWGHRQHGSQRVFALFSTGIALLAIGRMAESMEWGEWGMPMLVIGGFTIALAHFVNGRLCRACGHCNHDN